MTGVQTCALPISALVKNAIKGTAKGMPPKGGRPDVTDAEMESIVKYMVDSAK